MLKAKQESFHVLNDDLARKQKLIDDQTQAIADLKEKIEKLEETHTEARISLEARLSDKETDLKTKIALFEANLYEGRQYFEEMLNEKDHALKDALAELNQLKQRVMSLNGDEFVSEQQDTSMLNTSVNSTTNNHHSNLNKFDSENMKSMKALYEHQIELLKVNFMLRIETKNTLLKLHIFSQ